MKRGKQADRNVGRSKRKQNRSSPSGKDSWRRSRRRKWPRALWEEGVTSAAEAALLAVCPRNQQITLLFATNYFTDRVRRRLSIAQYELADWVATINVKKIIITTVKCYVPVFFALRSAVVFLCKRRRIIRTLNIITFCSENKRTVWNVAENGSKYFDEKHRIQYCRGSELTTSRAKSFEETFDRSSE